MGNQTHPYGPFLVTLTTAYELRWNDQGSGGNRDGAFWHAHSQGDLRPLGTVALQGYDDPNNKRATLLIGPNGQTSVASPVSYERVYTDEGTGAKRDGAIWRPVAPEGYVALGDVVTDRSTPSLNDIWCVRRDFLVAGKYAGEPIWDDRGTGGKYDVSIWGVSPRDTRFDADKVPLNGDTFISVDNYSEPSTALARALLVEAPAQIFPGGSREAPLLTSKIAPASSTALEKDRSVILPFTCLFPPNDQPSIDGIANPFISVERWGNWTLALFDNNTTGINQSSSTATTVGISQTQTESFQHSTGIKISSEVGIELVASVSVELNYQFTYTSSSSIESLRSETVTYNLTTLPQHAAALWVKHYAFRSVRSDGSIIGPDLPFNLNVTSKTQFPQE
ncbi:hypothetical protein G7Y89_g15653 [Cudoniella acicularis]|uniref:Insecticidal crystal toxin domain-containing protein n=1 Tax=Cudoniella acicularis TaxID=354080 RepID=A0A8H4QHT2_9HELO|nr:hypothetical protein G7Y89_g15653 [Cudoniella acicularis]